MVIKNEEMIRAHAPAAFATEPEKGRVSERYTFLPTTDILEVLQEEGWTCTSAEQVNSRSWSKTHGRHMLRLRHEDLQQKDFGVGDSIPEMVLINCHNGLGGYVLQGGIFRLVCSNGMVIAEEDFGKIQQRHIGFEPAVVVEASRQLILNSSKIADKIDSWQNTEMTERSRKDFFTDAAQLRFENPNDGLIQDVATPRREADRGTDLWSSFNVSQENLVRGGFRNSATNRMVRKITNIQKSVSLNQDLWELASNYALN